MSDLHPLNILVLLMLVRNCQGGPSASICGSEWTDSGSRCYRYYVGAQTYVDAITTCQGEGGQLAHAASEAEKTALNALMTVSSMWLGMHRKVSDQGTWVLSNGDTATYFDWKSGEPNNNAGIEDCVEMKSDGKWNDIPCICSYATQHSFICYQELSTQPTTTISTDNSAISATIAGVGGALVGAIAGFCVGRQFNKGRKEARNAEDIDRTSLPPSHSQFYPDDSRTLATGSRTDRLSTRQSGTDQLSTRQSGTDQLTSTGYAMPQLASNSSRMHHLSTAGSRIDQASRTSLNKGQSGSRLFNY